jgi:CHAD domain-containing protein
MTADMTVRATETEIKYDMPANAAIPNWHELPGVAATSAAQEQVLTAEYFDTGDLRLIRAGLTLRRRTGGSDAGWHLKLPAGGHSREEIRLPPGPAGASIPGQLADLVRARSRGAKLQPVATLTTTRLATTLLGRAGESLAEVAVDQVTATRQGEPATATRWQELEVELTGGDERLLAAAGRLLRHSGLSPSAHSAKLERALGGSLPVRSERRLAPSAPAQLVIAAYLSEQAELLQSLDPAVRMALPDSVHQMRVATRRLRSTLRTFGPVLTDSDTGQLAQELKWLGAVLGEARDAEVQEARLQRQISGTDSAQLLGPVQARVQAQFARERAAAQAGLAAALSSQRYLAILADLDAAAAGTAPGGAAGEAAVELLAQAVRRSYGKTRRRMRSAKRAPAGPDQDAALHQARKAAKQARYAAEAAAPVAGRDARRFAGQMKAMQSVLGEHQDAVVGCQLARQLGVSAYQAGENAFSYGLFYAQNEQNAQLCRERARMAWRTASRARYRRWLRARYDAG